MKYLLRSYFDCYIKINNDPYKLFAGLDKVVLTTQTKQTYTSTTNNENTQSDFFEVFSQNISSNSYCFFVEKNNKFSHPLVKLYKLNNDYAILLLQENPKFEHKSLAFLSTAENDYELLQNNKLELRCANQPIYKTSFFATGGKLEENENLIFAQFENKNEKKLIVLDKENNILIKDTISSLEYTQNGFQTLLILNDIHKQGIVKKYKIENNSLIVDEKYAVYINSMPKELYTSVATPLAFFQCIRANNFVLAKKYLNDELNSKITNEHFSAYFEEFDVIINCSKLFDKNIFALVSDKNKNCKLFEIDFYGDKIQNISPFDIDWQST